VKICRSVPCFFVITLLFVGCQSLAQRAHSSWLADFDRTDTLVARKKGEPAIRWTDQATIHRLREIYNTANWKPYSTTIPADINQRTITLYDSDQQLRQFSFCLGDFCESGSYSEIRTTELSPEELSWLESLFKPPNDHEWPIESTE
jgi:hypothetical protein